MYLLLAKRNMYGGSWINNIPNNPLDIVGKAITKLETYAEACEKYYNVYINQESYFTRTTNKYLNMLEQN